MRTEILDRVGEEIGKQSVDECYIVNWPLSTGKNQSTKSSTISETWGLGQQLKQAMSMSSKLRDKGGVLGISGRCF